MWRLLVVALLLGASAARAEKPSALEWGTLALAEASLLGDALQTLDIARRPVVIRRNRYSHVIEESNPFLGKHPSDAAIVGYFACAAVGTTALWAVLPKNLRILAPVVILAIEAPAIGRNVSNGLIIRF